MPPEIFKRLAANLAARQRLGLLKVSGNQQDLQILRTGSREPAGFIAPCPVCPECPLGSRPACPDFGASPARLLLIAPPPQGQTRPLSPLPAPAMLLLENMLKAIALDWSQVHLTTFPKCPSDLIPASQALAACRLVLDRQLTDLNPHAIVTLGSLSLRLMLQLDQEPSQMMGREQEYGGRFLLPLPDPCFLLKNPGQKALAYAALKLLAQTLAD